MINILQTQICFLRMEFSMFCPLCRSEYKEGITQCVDCKIDLVEELPEESEASGTSEIDADFVEWANNHPRDLKRLLEEEKTEDEIVQEALAKCSNENSNRGAYVSLENRAEEYKSSGYTLLLVGIIGAVVLILSVLKVINIPFAGFNSYMSYGVLTVLFVIFIVMGIRSIKDSKQFAQDSVKEKELEKEIKEWFIASFPGSDIDADCTHEESLESLEDVEVYYQRCENMKAKLTSKYIDLSEEFVEKLIEDLYQDIYEN